MRFERWYWLILFCLLSLGIHTVVGITTPRLPGGGGGGARAGEFTVELPPLKEPPPKKEPKREKPEPKPKPKREPKPKAIVRKQPDKLRIPKTAPRRPRQDVKPQRMAAAKPAPEPKIRVPEPRPRRERVDLGGERDRKPIPLPQGRSTTRRDLRPERMARTVPMAPPEPNPAPERDALPPDEPKLNAEPGRVNPRLRLRGAPGVLDPQNPLLGTGPNGPEEKVQFASQPGSANRPQLRDARAQQIAGGGAPSSGPVPGGKDGFRGPEQPDDGILFHGGGAGGTNLPKVKPRIGGGGGRSVLALNNPLAKELASDDKPGEGPGTGGGAGTGAGGGNGFGRGPGRGTALGGPALAALRTKPGSGLGAGKGSGSGTAPPGGGSGRGADLPGNGGNGFGYGGGSRTGIGNGSGPGIGGGRGGPRLARGGGRGDGGGGGGAGGGGGRVALNRGIPFGDITGLLRGDPDGGGGRGGGPGGPGRGSLPGRGGSPAGSAAVHIVYVIDTSGSMVQGDKIGKAKEALKKAIGELKAGDSFNVICFDDDAREFSTSLVEASDVNKGRALRYVDAIQLRAGTNISAGMERALSQRATHIFLLSDGEPSRGVTNEGQLRALIRSRNQDKALIATLALGLGEDFRGISLLKGIAAENGGQFNYVNLAR